MSWSFGIGIITSVLSLGLLIVLWNDWITEKQRLNYYQIRYKLRDAQLDSTLTMYENLNKKYDQLLDEHLAHDLATSAQLQEQSEKIGELEVELSLAHSRNEQVVEQLLAAEAKCAALQDELDTIFAVGGSDV